MNVPAWAFWTGWALQAVWLLSAVGVAVVMGRRGHDRQLWAVIGIAAGPFAVGAAVISARRAARRHPVIVVQGRPGSGTHDALIGVGGDEFLEKIDAAIRGSRSEWRRVALAAVIGRDTLDSAARRADFAAARRDLWRAVAVARAAGVDPDAVMLEGRPRVALLDFARQEGFDRVFLPGIPGPAIPELDIHESGRQTTIRPTAGPRATSSSREGSNRPRSTEHSTDLVGSDRGEHGDSRQTGRAARAQ